MKLPVIAEPKTEAAVQAPPAEKKVNPNNKRGYLFSKRCIDVIGALAGLLVLLIVFIVIGLLIKIEDPKGSIFFSQKRVGKNGKEFNMYKFRSMVSDAEAKLAELLQQNEATGAMFKMKNDPRVTKIGRFIRKTSIDELPQLFNVLKGDMSIIGPRPLLPFMLKNLPEFKEIRSLVRPGITGLWQIRDRENNTSAEFMVEHDTEYVENYSFILDMKIFFKTPIIVITGDGAY